MLTHRSDRLALPIAITYCISATITGFKVGMNISDSGVLFVPRLGAGTSLEVIFAAPVNIGSMASGKLVCAAEVCGRPRRRRAARSTSAVPARLVD